MKILKSKKGIVLENALLFMMIIFALCFLVASFALIGHYQGDIENSTIMHRVEVDRIGEDFLRGELVGEGESGYYSFEVNDGTLRVWHKNDPEKTVVLYVEKDGEGNPIVWRYSEPEP